MFIAERREGRERGLRTIGFALLLAVLAAGVAGCKKEQPAQEQVKRYKLVGKIVEVQGAQKTLIIDGQEIPGFMAAMTMPYPVRDPKWMANLGAGDEITADLEHTFSPQALLPDPRIAQWVFDSVTQEEKATAMAGRRQ